MWFILHQASAMEDLNRQDAKCAKDRTGKKRLSDRAGKSGEDFTTEGTEVGRGHGGLTEGSAEHLCEPPLTTVTFLP